MGENGWTFVAEDGATGDTLYGLDFLHQIYTKADPAYSRPRDGAGAVGQEAADHRLQRIRRDHPDAEFRPSTNGATPAVDFYPEALRARDRRAQCAGLSRRQQRRLSRRLRHHAGGL